MTHPTSFTFTVPGPLYAYRRLRDHGGYRQYALFKIRVLALAMQRGWRRMETSKDQTRRIDMTIHWKKGPRIDLSNVLKGIEDALFSQDRWITCAVVQVYVNQPEEQVEVTILGT